jgi:hypothetical protein
MSVYSCSGSRSPHTEGSDDLEQAAKTAKQARSPKADSDRFIKIFKIDREGLSTMEDSAHAVQNHRKALLINL